MESGRVAIVIKHHCQPPIETMASRWTQVMEFDPETPIREVFEQAFNQGDVEEVILPHQI